MDQEKFAQAIQRLPLELDSEHFIIRYGLRNPREGNGLGPDGVADSVLARSYRNSLERLYQTMTRPPWSRPAPRVGSYGKTIVYICDIDYPFTGQFGTEGVPFIALPSRSREPMNDAAMRRAAAEAVHEATHVFNFTERPFATGDWWKWFDEALAVYLESRVLPGNHDYFRYLTDWVDLPGLPVNDWTAEYQSCLLIHYLSARLGPSFPNQVWTKSKPEEKPLEALQRLVKAKRVPPQSDGARSLTFASANPNKRDLFASGYAMDCYFLRDHASGCFSPEICTRFGDRAVVSSCNLDRGKPITLESKLPHLACDYFRIYPHRGVDRVRFVMYPGAGAKSELKAEAVIAHPDFHRGKVVTLGSGAPKDGPDGIRAAELDDLASQDLSHLVVVVSNCHLEDVHWNAKGTYPGETFRIEVSAD